MLESHLEFVESRFWWRKSLSETLSEVEQLKLFQTTIHDIRAKMAQVIVGQSECVEEIILGLITGGHVLIEGVPGLAKTTMVSTLAEVLQLQYQRIQFTPDLMPADILGSEILEENKATGQRSLRFEKGPIFTQILLADEINRTPPKTQAALLQAMQEKFVSVAGQGFKLPEPFIVFATQNPIENEGTYPLPEAQLDRFMLKVVVQYPNLEEERRIAPISPRERLKKPDPVTHQMNWGDCYRLIEQMPLSETVVHAAVNLVRASRPEVAEADQVIKENIRWGAGPRASQYLLQAIRGLAAMRGESTPTIEHLKAVAKPILRHRIIPSFSAEARHFYSEDAIDHLVKKYL